MFGVLTIVISVAIIAPLSYMVINAIRFVVKSRKHLKQILKLPGREPPHPFWGHVYDFPGPGEAGFRYMFEVTLKEQEILVKIQYGPLVGAVGLVHFESVKHILKTAEPKPSGLGAYNFIKPWLGDGLLIAGGKKWARNRRLLTPAFHFDILKPYLMINNQCADIFLNKLSLHSKSGEYVEMFSEVSLLTLDIILKCAFSYDIDCQQMGNQHPYVKAVTELSEAAVYRMLRPLLYPDFIYYYLSSTGRRFRKNCDYVHAVAEDIIKKRKRAFVDYGDSILRHHKYIDFLDILLKAQDTDGEGLSDLDIRNEVDTFLFEGHDTTASGISWTLYSLAGHPEFQERCQQEVDDVLSRRDSHDILWDDLSSFPYLTMCIKESMRLHSTVPVLQRFTTKEMNIEGHNIPKDTMIEINLYLLHHNIQIWDNPFEFRPDRFTPENVAKMDPYQYVPFSAGPRNCIGQNFAMHEMKVVIARILSKFSFEIDPAREVKHEVKAVMKTENGMYLKVTAR